MMTVQFITNEIGWQWKFRPATDRKVWILRFADDFSSLETAGVSYLISNLMHKCMVTKYNII